MRPPDENQNGSTRPNFMSASRRAAGGDDNILARLERDAKRGPSASSWSNHARLAWCGLAALAIFGLIGILASLAKENLAGHRQPTLIEAKSAPDLFANGGFAPLPAPAPSTLASTPLVDLPIAPPKSKSTDRDGVPPLVMLKQGPAPVKTAPPVKMAAAVSKPVQQPSAKMAALTPAPRGAPARPAAKSTPPKSAAARPAASPARPALAAATPAPARLAVATPQSRPVVATAPARKKTASAAAPAKAEAAAVDSDVALLSAIIMHASRHSAERAQIEAAQCGPGKKCPQSEAAAALKATD